MPVMTKLLLSQLSSKVGISGYLKLMITMPQNWLDPDSLRSLVDLGLQNSPRQLESLFPSSNFNSEGAQGIAVFRLDDR